MRYNIPMDKLERFRQAKYIFVVGIGGSDLASKAVWSAMTMHKVGVEKKVFFLESPEAREYEEVTNFVNITIAAPEEVVMLVVSKSGKTEETLTTFHKTFDILSEKFGKPISDRVITISMRESPLSQIAKEKGFTNLDWEGDIGGRFSAFTIAHTAVLHIAGLNTEKFKDGKMEISKDKAEELAEAIFESYKKGADILDIFVFNNELEDLGKWVRQLVAESLATLTPTVSLGPSDLHSMLELYLEKPGTRFTLFVSSIKELAGSVNQSAYQNTVKEYERVALPFYKYEMSIIDERELGKFMAFMIDVTLQLAKLLGVDPYDQPRVEEYKHQISI